MLYHHFHDVYLTLFLFQDNEKNYKSILVPLLGQVLDQLKNKHITDVKVFLVGITSKYPYPIIYDTDSECSISIQSLF